MKFTFFEEPDLEFAGGGTHIDAERLGEPFVHCGDGPRMIQGQIACEQ